MILKNLYNEGIILYILNKIRQEMNQQYLQTEITSFQSNCTENTASIVNQNCSQYRVSIFLTSLGIYFLIFSLIQIITNYQETFYSVPMMCQGKKCISKIQFISFADTNSIFLYLVSPSLSQADISFDSLPNSQLDSFITNKDCNKQISITGADLQPTQQAYPSGQFQSYYIEGTFKIKDQVNSQIIDISTDSLTFDSVLYQNQRDLSLHWANVESERYHVWKEEQISFGLKKFWGKIYFSFSSNFTIQIVANNKIEDEFAQNFSVYLSNGRALDGYNWPLCIINAIFSVFMLFFSGFSFTKGLGTGQSIKVANSHEFQISHRQNEQKQ